jgi:hypothetical protein
LWSQIPVQIEWAPLGAAGLAAGVAGITFAVWRTYRRLDLGLWWTLPVALTGLTFPIVFASLSRPNQPYVDRYTYFLAPALVLGVVILFQLVSSAKVATIGGSLILLVGATSAVLALTEVHRADYKGAAEVARPLIDAGNIILFEQEATIARYRPGAFPGVPIYIPHRSAVIGTNQAANGELPIEPGHRPLILVSDLQQSIEAWTAVEVGDHFHMLIPEQDSETWGARDQAAALWSACQGFSPDNGSYLCVTAVRMLWESGDFGAARAYARSTLDRIETEVVKERIGAVLQDISPDLIPKT